VLQQLLRPLLLLASSSNIKQPVDMHHSNCCCDSKKTTTKIATGRSSYGMHLPWILLCRCRLHCVCCTVTDADWVVAISTGRASTGTANGIQCCQTRRQTLSASMHVALGNEAQAACIPTCHVLPALLRRIHSCSCSGPW
jgi:hypothetical protein